MRISIVSGSRMKSTGDSVFKAKMKDVSGGGGGIRTHEPREELAVFKTAAIVHSATPPCFDIISGYPDQTSWSCIHLSNASYLTLHTGGPVMLRD